MKVELMKLLLKVSPTSSFKGCWNWGAARTARGYGKVADGQGGWRLAHRVMWETENGAIPEGLEVCHECDNPACINPAHLFLGSHAENMSDCKKKGRSAAPRGEENPRSKLTERDVLEIRASGLTAKMLAAKHGVSDTMIRSIKAKKAWRHIADAPSKT